MLANGQTLVHIKTRKLVRLEPEPSSGSSFDMWAWNIGKKTAFIAKDGTKFIDDINNYIAVRDELDRPCYSGPPAEGQFVDERLEKYLVGSKKLAKMRKKRLEKWEAKVLDSMKNGGPDSITKILPNGLKSTTYPSGYGDVAGKCVRNPFADGSKSLLFEKFFLERRRAVPLYKKWNSIMKKYIPGPMVFRHTDGHVWLYDGVLHDLIVIKDIRSTV